MQILTPPRRTRAVPAGPSRANRSSFPAPPLRADPPNEIAPPSPPARRPQALRGRRAGGDGGARRRGLGPALSPALDVVPRGRLSAGPEGPALAGFGAALGSGGTALRLWRCAWRRARCPPFLGQGCRGPATGWRRRRLWPPRPPGGPVGAVARVLAVFCRGDGRQKRSEMAGNKPKKA